MHGFGPGIAAGDEEKRHEGLVEGLRQDDIYNIFLCSSRARARMCVLAHPCCRLRRHVTIQGICEHIPKARSKELLELLKATGIVEPIARVRACLLRHKHAPAGPRAYLQASLLSVRVVRALDLVNSTNFKT